MLCACRPLLDLLVRASRSNGGGLLGRIAGHRAGTTMPGLVVRAGLFVFVVGGMGAAIVAAGAPARGVVVPAAADVLGRVPHDVDPATFPSISVDQDVLDWNHEITGPGAREIVLTLAENLQLENQALLRADPAILEAVDHGDRLDEMRDRLQSDGTSGAIRVERYRIDTVNVRLLVPFGKQDGLSLGLESRGEMTTETYDTAGHLEERASAPFAKTFVVRRATGARWLNVAVLSR